MSTLEFHARASSAALAKFAAEDDEASVTACWRAAAVPVGRPRLRLW